MTRAGAGALVAIALTAGLALRSARLDSRPMHHDEANQAIKFGDLLERGEYRYDVQDHHGPTLYYLTLPAAWIRGQQTLASLDEATIRGVPVAFGVATILLLPLLSAGIGRPAVATAAMLMAISPAMVFYSRMYIQEALFACFTLAFVIALGRTVTGGGLTWPALAGVAAGLAIATKETAVIVLPAALAACVVAWWSVGSSRPRSAIGDGRWRRAVLVGAAAATAVAAVFYSSFFTAPAALLEPFRGGGIYFDRAVDPDAHAHPWYYYLRLLAYSSSSGVTWSEGLVLVLAAIGALAAWRRPEPARSDGAFWARYLACNAAIAAAIFSAIPYKTPWNLLPAYVGAFALAGVGFASLVARSGRGTRAVLVAALALASLQLGGQAWRAAVTYAADPRNPYVYAQTVPGAVRMAARVRNLSALHADGARMQVSVIAPPHEQWPHPWYLRTLPNVGYWAQPGDAAALRAPVVVSSIDHTPALDQALGDRYISEFYGLRPDVLQALYIERGLWDRFLATTAGTASAR